jgi:transketolase
VDILVAAYWGVVEIDPQRPDSPDRDRFILSKGHAATALYSALARRGFYPVDLLQTFAEAGSVLGEQPIPGSIPGMEAATGSLGHGLSIGAGMALAAKIQQRRFRVFVVLSDGECNEGSVWEAAMFAPAKGLDNILAVVDYNRWQATARSDEVMALAPLREKWQAFGWDTHLVDGHDTAALVNAMSKVPNGTGKPIALIAQTVKGRGVSFMEDDNNWHYRVPTADEVVAAKHELALR